MKLTQQVQRSTQSLNRAGAALVTNYKDSGAKLVERTLDAGAMFVQQTAAAKDVWLDDTKKASRSLIKDVRKEAKGVKKALKKDAQNVTERVTGTTEEATNKVKKITLLTQPATVRTWILNAAKTALESMQRKVDAALEPSKTTKPSRKRVTQSAGSNHRARVRKTEPLRGYDGLKASDVISKLSKLSPTQADAVLRYELGKKHRATVIRAARARVARA